MLKRVLKKLGYFNLVVYLRNHSALFAKYYTYFSLTRKAKKNSILVYTMGKVGSSTIKHSLNNYLEDYSVYHIHWLNKNNLDTDKEFTIQFYHRNKKRGIDTAIFPNYLIRGYYLNNRINWKGTDEGQYKIITLTRDPVARNVSSFFQNVKKFFGYDISEKLKTKNEDRIVEELMDLFVNEFIDKNKINFIDSDPLTWFDEELNHSFGIDVYSDEFPKEKGYEIYPKGNISALLIRLENLDECFEEACKYFLGKEIKIKSLKNTGEKKEYYSVYNKFKNNIEIPVWYLDKMYNSKYANHFYTKEEISSFRNRWELNESPTMIR